MRAYSCERCGWATDEASSGWDRFSKLGTCPRCESKREPVAFFRSPGRMLSTAGKLVWVVGFAVILGAVLGLAFGDAPFTHPFRAISIALFAAWVFRRAPDRPL